MTATRDHLHWKGKAVARAVFFPALLLFLALTSLARGEGNSPALPEAARTAIDKGVQAAKRKDWQKAIDYFTKARDAAPDSPQPLYNLGLAEAQIPGRELRAIAWLDAYLQVAPGAANSEAVAKKLGELEEAAQANAGEIIDLLERLQTRLPTSNFWFNQLEPRSDLAGLLAKKGDLDGAEKLVASFPTVDMQNRGREVIAIALAQAGAISEAQRVADAITSGSYEHTFRQIAYHSIAWAQIATGHFEQAKALVDKLSPTYENYDHQVYLLKLQLAEAEYQAGLKDDANVLFEDGLLMIFDAPYPFNLQYRAKAVGFAYRMGREKTAETMLGQVKDAVPGAAQHKIRMELLAAAAEATNEMGRRDEALALLKEAAAEYAAAGRAKEDPSWVDFLRPAVNMGAWNEAREWLAKNSDNVNNLKGASSTIPEAVCGAAKASALDVLSNSDSTPAQRAQSYHDYIEACLSAPLYSDFRATLAGLGSFQSSSAQFGAVELFDHVKKPAEDMLDRLQDLRDLRKWWSSGCPFITGCSPY